MSPPVVKVLEIPLHKDLLAGLEAAMQEEMSKAANPVVIEAYIVAVLTNFWFNWQVNHELSAKQREIESDIRGKIITYTNATLQHLKLKA